MNNFAIITQSQEAPSQPNPSCAYQIRLNDDVYQCMTQAQYNAYQQQQAQDVAAGNKQTPYILLGLLGFILLVVIGSMVSSKIYDWWQCRKEKEREQWVSSMMP